MREQMTWEDLGTAVDELAAKIRADGFRPDAVLALARSLRTRAEAYAEAVIDLCALALALVAAVTVGSVALEKASTFRLAASCSAAEAIHQFL